MTSTLSAACLAAALLAPAHAWWGNGHLLTARVAYDDLIESDPEIV